MKPSDYWKIATCMAAIAVSAPVTASDSSQLCTNIHGVIDQVGTNFADIVVGSSQENGRHPVSLHLDDAASCSVLPLPNGGAYHCLWEFPLQAPDAYQKFEYAVRNVKACLGPDATLLKDQGVNHPDFYDARRFELESASVIVSVKDKSTLKRTFVNVWIRAAEK